MRKYFPLYIKELKSLRAPFLMLAVTYLFFIGYLLFSEFSSFVLDNIFNYRANLTALIKMSMFIFPGILFYSFYEERAYRTSHQTLTLPIPRYAVMINKSLASLSIGAVAVILLTLYYYIFELKLHNQYGSYEYQTLHPLHYALMLFMNCYVLICLINATIGLLSAVKRYHVLIGIFSFAVFYKLSSLMIRYIISLFGSVFRVQDINAFSMISQNDNILITIISFAIPLVVGSVFLLFGLYVFHKLSDI